MSTNKSNNTSQNNSIINNSDVNASVTSSATGFDSINLSNQSSRQLSNHSDAMSKSKSISNTSTDTNNTSINMSNTSIDMDESINKDINTDKTLDKKSLIQKGEGLQVVIGLGQSGLATVHYLSRRGYRIAVTDGSQNPALASQLPDTVDIRSFGGIDGDLLLQASRIIISPGVPLTMPEVARAKQAGIDIVSDIQLFKEACQAPIVAITGSNAKSTVTTLVGDMAKNAGINVGIGGNIGVPALSLLDDESLGEHMQLAVLELSSFQLETVTNLGAKVATVLNMSPDHLDRHGDMLGYHQAKHRIFQGAQSIVVNRDDALSRPLIADNIPRLSVGTGAPNIGEYGLITEGDGQLFLAKGTKKIINANELKIKGMHNLLNALTALAIGELAGIDFESMLDTLRVFGGLSHRCQFVASIDGVDYFNDSKGTNVGSTIAAISGLGAVYDAQSANSENSGKTKLLLILGGQGKNQTFGDLVPLINQYVSQVLLIGEDADKIEHDLKQAQLNADVELSHCDTLSGAMDKASILTRSSLSQVGAVLLSPACASFDQFSGYAERGNAFIDLVKR